MFEFGWVGKSFVTAIFFVPWIIAVGFLAKNYSIRPEVTLLWYFVGIIIGVAGGLWGFDIVGVKDFAPSVPLLMVLVMGIVFGGFSNILVFQAIATAPNPALPMAIINASSILAFLVAIACASIFPKWFDIIQFDAYHLVGIFLTVVGVALVAIRR